LRAAMVGAARARAALRGGGCSGCGGLRRRRFAAVAAEVEYTIHPYQDRQELNFNRSSEFCMMTLRHPEVQRASEQQRAALYAKKVVDRGHHLKTVFGKYLKDGKAFLDREELQEALAAVQVPSADIHVNDILHRYDGKVDQESFKAAVHEAWGRPPALTYCDRLAPMHDGVMLRLMACALFSGWAGRRQWIIACAACGIFGLTLCAQLPSWRTPLTTLISTLRSCR